MEKKESIFPRLDMKVEIKTIDETTLEARNRAEENAKKGESKVEETVSKVEKHVTEEISIDDFFKSDLRVAQVITAERIPNADKLLKLQLDLGYEQRQVVSGIAKYYTPEDLVGKKVICVTNLKPVKLRGEVSNGMILAASHDNQLVLATVPEMMPNGAQVK